jgi:hypothetical protein
VVGYFELLQLCAVFMVFNLSYLTLGDDRGDATPDPWSITPLRMIVSATMCIVTGLAQHTR